jgi:hypothetical protein
MTRLLVEDNNDSLEEVLMGERNLETISSTKKGKRRK